MNILFINTNYGKGGAARVARDLKKGLEAHGHIISFFSASAAHEAEHAYALPKASKLGRVFQKLTGTEIRFNNSDALLQHPAFKASDVVHLHNLHGRYFDLSTLKRVAREKPIVWTLHDMWAVTSSCAYSYEDTPDKDGFYACQGGHDQRAKREAYAEANPILVSPSLWLKEKVEQSILRDKRSVHIPNGIDSSIFRVQDKAAARAALQLPQDKKIVLFVAAGGSDDPRKGWRYVEDMMRHFADDPSVLFVPVGGASFVSDPEILARYYAAADVLLFTSLRENFSLVILEALASGLPVVGFGVGGVPEAVTHLENGYLVPLGDVKGLAEGITHILRLPPSEQRAMKAANRAKIENLYTLEIMTDAYAALYRSLT